MTMGKFHLTTKNPSLLEPMMYVRFRSLNKSFAVITCLDLADSLRSASFLYFINTFLSQPRHPAYISIKIPHNRSSVIIYRVPS